MSRHKTDRNRARFSGFANRAAFSGLALLCLSASASGETRRLEFEIEPIIMLNCVERVNYTIDTADLLFARADSIPKFRANGRSAGTARKIEARFSADDLLKQSDETLIEIDIDNACSVRGLGRGEGFLVNVRPADQGSLVNTTQTGILAVRDARGRVQRNGAFSNRFSIPQSRIRLDTPIKIDVQLRVDMRNANGSGRYSSPVDGVFSIEVSAP